MSPEEVERVVGQISEKDVMDFARRKLWDKDVAISAVGSIEGLLDYNSKCRLLPLYELLIHRRLHPFPAQLY